MLAKKRAKMEFAWQALSRRGWVWEHTESLVLTKEPPAANVLYVWLVVVADVSDALAVARKHASECPPLDS